ncbi:hypothetical protein A2U01_0036729, partial [Trifolium medium]|nr:hypothetical protein [Trifolium medium]
RNSEHQRKKTDKIQGPGEEQRASSLSEPIPRLARYQIPVSRLARLPVAQRRIPRFGLSLDNWPWPRPNPISTTFNS